MDNIEEINIIVEDEAPIDVSAELEDDFLRGEKGPSNVLTIGSVEKGEEAAASITGKSPNQKLNLVLPKGDTGNTGAKGDKGDNGNDGYTPIKGTDYFTEEEIQEIKQDILDKVNQFSVLVVQELPAENIDEHTIYFVPKATVEQNDVYDEFIYINNSWEHIGTTEVDLSSYYNKSEVDAKLEAVEGNEVYIGNEEDAPATAKIVIDEDETDWEDEGEIYSTTERKIGKWIDGKTLYRKVINTTAPTCEQDGTYVTSTIDIADNIDFAVIELGFIVDSANQKQTFPYINNSGNVIKAFINVNKQIHLAHNIKSYNGYAVTIIVKYTKTTEEA